MDLWGNTIPRAVIRRCDGLEEAVSIRRRMQECGRALFGECGEPALGVDVLRAGAGPPTAAAAASAVLRVPAAQLRRTRAALALAPTIRDKKFKMAQRTVYNLGIDGKDMVIVASPEELAAPSTVTLPEPEPTPGLILPDGSINWGCPCLGGMATGPCGMQFRDAFSCFHYSEAEPKGSDCYEKFSVMQACMAKFPELYAKDDDEELANAFSAEDKKAEAIAEVSHKEGTGETPLVQPVNNDPKATTETLAAKPVNNSPQVTNETPEAKPVNNESTVQNKLRM